MKKFLMLIPILFLFGCNEKEEALLASPKVTSIGEFEGCDVKFVNRGYETRSFYLAHCDAPSSTVSDIYSYQQGKVTKYATKLSSVTKEVECDEECQKQKLIASALKKLSKQEREILGIK